MTDNALAKTTTAGLATDAKLDAAVAESLVVHGDYSRLNSGQRVELYLRTCREHGLNPQAQPFTFLRLNGKEVMYANKGCTDQLARIHNVTREIIDGPKVIDLAGTKLVFCAAKATLPNGRSETSTATVPLVDPANVLMKAESKAKRRATLSIFGLAMLDESELDTIPAGAKAEAPQVNIAAPLPPLRSLGIEPPARPAPVAEPPASDPERDAIRQESAPDDGPPGFAADVQRIELPGEAVGVWMKHRAAVAAMEPTEREAAWKALCARTEEVGKMKNARVWLKKAIAEEDARRQAAASSEAAS